MIIDLHNVRFAYPQAPDKNVLNIKAWSVTAKQHVFIHGPSASGKSTLLNLLSGMICATDGTVTVLGQQLEQMRERQRDRFRAEHIGYVFQQFNLIPYLDALDNIHLAHYFSPAKTHTLRHNIEQLLTKLNIARADWHKPTANLSIGQQQRVAIARALINKPELLIADEPTSSLDQSNRDNFMSMLMSLTNEYNMTLLFVSHDMSLSHYFSRSVALADINQQESPN